MPATGSGTESDWAALFGALRGQIRYSDDYEQADAEITGMFGEAAG